MDEADICVYTDEQCYRSWTWWRKRSYFGRLRNGLLKQATMHDSVLGTKGLRLVPATRLKSKKYGPASVAQLAEVRDGSLAL